MCLPGPRKTSSFTFVLSTIQVREFIQPLYVPVRFLRMKLSHSFCCMLRSEGLSLPPAPPSECSNFRAFFWCFPSLSCSARFWRKNKQTSKQNFPHAPDNLMSKNSIKTKIDVQSANLIIQRRLCDTVPDTHPGISGRSLHTILTLAAGSFFPFQKEQALSQDFLVKTSFASPTLCLLGCYLQCWCILCLSAYHPHLQPSSEMLQYCSTCSVGTSFRNRRAV